MTSQNARSLASCSIASVMNSNGAASDPAYKTTGISNSRPDVLTFTTAELTADLEFKGFPLLDVSVSVDNPYADLFVRICDVDQLGRSRNITDTLVPLDTTVPAGEIQQVSARLLPCARRLLKGHRLRLQLSGGAHPQYARNLGTGERRRSGPA